MSRNRPLPDAGYLRGIAAQLRSRARSVAAAALREQLLALAEYYEEMAASTAAPVLAAPSR